MKKNEITNALDLWKRETDMPSIVTSSKQLDKILDDGVKLGRITEFIGLPGTGKTQLSMQLCVNVQLPTKLGGLNGEAIYLSTNNNFTTERIQEMIEASLNKCASILGSNFKTSLSEAMDKVHLIETVGLIRFLAAIRRICDFIIQNNKIRLLVIDSITFPFLNGITERRRTGILFETMATLQELAHQHRIAIVLINEMSNRIGVGINGVVGAMGDAWAHRPNSRLLLSKDSKGRHHVAIVKSNEVMEQVAEFQITEEGIMDAG